MPPEETTLAHPLTRDGHLERLAASRPTQADLDTAARVVRWLSDHAHFFPEEYGAEQSFHLAQAANACGVAPAELLCSAEAYAAREEQP